MNIYAIHFHSYATNKPIFTKDKREIDSMFWNKWIFLYILETYESKDALGRFGTVANVRAFHEENLNSISGIVNMQRP